MTPCKVRKTFVAGKIAYIEVERKARSAGSGASKSHLKEKHQELDSRAALFKPVPLYLCVAGLVVNAQEAASFGIEEGTHRFTMRAILCNARGPVFSAKHQTQ